MLLWLESGARSSEYAHRSTATDRFTFSLEHTNQKSCRGSTLAPIRARNSHHSTAPPACLPACHALHWSPSAAAEWAKPSGSAADPCGPARRVRPSLIRSRSLRSTARERPHRAVDLSTLEHSVFIVCVPSTSPQNVHRIRAEHKKADSASPAAEMSIRTKLDPRHHCISPSACDAQTCINVRPNRSRRYNIKKHNSKSPLAIRYAQMQLQISAGAETCINVRPYFVRITSGAQTCTDATPNRRRRCDMHKRNSKLVYNSPAALQPAQTQFQIAAGGGTCIHTSPYSLQITSGAQAYTIATPNRSRCCHMQKRNS